MKKKKVKILVITILVVLVVLSAAALKIWKDYGTAHTVTVKLTKNGEYVSDFTVSPQYTGKILFSINAREIVLYCPSDENGSVVLRGMTRGSYTFTIYDGIYTPGNGLEELDNCEVRYFDVYIRNRDFDHTIELEWNDGYTEGETMQ